VRSPAAEKLVPWLPPLRNFSRLSGARAGAAPRRMDHAGAVQPPFRHRADNRSCAAAS